jgi:hypothetical protein
MCGSASTWRPSGPGPAYRKTHSHDGSAFLSALCAIREQGRRKPDGPAMILLSMLERDPHIVERTLAKAA